MYRVDLNTVLRCCIICNGEIRSETIRILLASNSNKILDMKSEMGNMYIKIDNGCVPLFDFGKYVITNEVHVIETFLFST